MAASDSTIIDELNQLTEPLPPFIAISKLQKDTEYFIERVIRRTAGVDGAPYDGVQLWIRHAGTGVECRTSMPGKLATRLMTDDVRFSPPDGHNDLQREEDNKKQ